MNPQARDRLRELIAASGGAAFQTPRVLEVQVAQALQDLPAERDALVAVLRHGFVERIRAGQNQLEPLAAELKAKAKLTDGEAMWALESWRELAHGVRSKSLDRGDAYLAHEKTKGMSFRPPTRDQFARSGLIAGVLAGLLVGAFWGGIKAFSLARPVTRTVATYGPGSSADYHSMRVAYGSPTYQRRTVDLKFGRQSILAWVGWIVAGGLIGSVVGGISALYLSRGPLKFVGGYSGAAVGALAGIMNGHHLIHIAPAQGASLSDLLAQVLAGLFAGVLVGVLLGGFRDLILNFRSELPGPFTRFLFRMPLEA